MVRRQLAKQPGLINLMNESLSNFLLSMSKLFIDNVDDISSLNNISLDLKKNLNFFKKELYLQIIEILKKYEVEDPKLSQNFNFSSELINKLIHYDINSVQKNLGSNLKSLGEEINKLMDNIEKLQKDFKEKLLSSVNKNSDDSTLILFTRKKVSDPVIILKNLLETTANVNKFLVLLSAKVNKKFHNSI